jgi:hypothetical protein
MAQTISQPGTVLWSGTIKGDARTKKNSMMIVGSGSRCPRCKKFAKQWVKQSPQHDAWYKDASRQLVALPSEPISGPVQLVYIVYTQTRRIVDDLNLYAAIDDLLVANDILDDDNTRIVKSRDGSRVRYDKDKPRTEVVVTRMGVKEDAWTKQ